MSHRVVLTSPSRGLSSRAIHNAVASISLGQWEAHDLQVWARFPIWQQQQLLIVALRPSPIVLGKNLHEPQSHVLTLFLVRLPVITSTSTSTSCAFAQKNLFQPACGEWL